MTERTLTASFQPWAVYGDAAPSWQPLYPMNYSQPRESIFYSESSIDLSGYNLNDLTVFFRSSFEQKSGPYTVYWNVDDGEVSPTELALVEQVIITSVPMDDDQIQASWISSPGFEQYPASLLGANYDWGNFDRGQIIHGHFTYHGPNAQTAASYAANGYAVLTPLVSEYYSSLEPSAADRLYCYRMFKLVGGAVEFESSRTGPYQVHAPALRVVLPIVTAEEPWLEYVMRQSRGYELANQV